jgi:hypothetical protein
MDVEISNGNRATRRQEDFVDLACFLRNFPNVSLGELLELLRRKYGNMYPAHLLRAEPTSRMQSQI